MPIPTVNTFFVNDTKIGLYWKASPTSAIRTWNLYGAPQVTLDFIPPNKGVVLPGTAPAIFTKIRNGLPNYPDTITPGSCYVEVTRAELGISTYDPYYFILTSNTETAPGVFVESALAVKDIHGVPYADDFTVDEAGWPCNVVYNNYEFDLWPLSGWDADRYLDIVALMGRPAREVKIDSVGANIWVRFNSLANDPISIRSSQPYPFDLKRGELVIDKIFVHNPTPDDATVRVFVAG